MKRKEKRWDKFVDVAVETAFRLVRHGGKIVFLGLISYCVSQIGFQETIYRMPDIILFTLSILAL